MRADVTEFLALVVSVFILSEDYELFGEFGHGDDFLFLQLGYVVQHVEFLHVEEALLHRLQNIGVAGLIILFEIV